MTQELRCPLAISHEKLRYEAPSLRPLYVKLDEARKRRLDLTTEIPSYFFPGTPVGFAGDSMHKRSEEMHKLM